MPDLLPQNSGPLYDPNSIDHRRKLAAELIRALTMAQFKRINTAEVDKEQVWVRYLFKTELVPQQGRRPIRKQVKTRFRIKVCTSVVAETTPDGRPTQTVIVREKDTDAIYVMLTYLREDRHGEDTRYREVVLARFKIHRCGFLHGIPGRVIARGRLAHQAQKDIKVCPWCKTAPLAKSKKTGKDYCADACWERQANS